MNLESPSRKTLQQLLIYALIGVMTNVFGYALYLFLTYFWGAPKLTMTLLYSIGALIGFLGNRRYTFRHDGHIGVAGLRYLFAQLVGYLLNLTLLVLFVDWLGFVHQIVQAVAIVVVAIFLFILSRFFVFAPQLAEKGAIRS
jgi:putative flippase GtrA